jgi:hypothetical protein
LSSHVCPTLRYWEVLAKSCDEESPGWLWWVTKYVTGVCGVGKFLERWKSRNHSQCPRCDAANEDHCHVYQCSACNTKLEWDGEMNDLQQWCDSIDTSPTISTEVYFKCLKAWQPDWSLPPPYRGRDVLAHAYNELNGLSDGAVSWKEVSLETGRLSKTHILL